MAFPDLLRQMRALGARVAARSATARVETAVAPVIVKAAAAFTHQVWVEPFAAPISLGRALAALFSRRVTPARSGGESVIAVMPPTGAIDQRLVLIVPARSPDAVDVALGVCEQMSGGPARHTEVWCVFIDGGASGVHAFLDRHGHMLTDASFLVLDEGAVLRRRGFRVTTLPDSSPGPSEPERAVGHICRMVFRLDAAVKV